ARHQQHRAAHQPAAGDAIELGHAGGQARGLMGFAGERLEREYATLARRTTGDRAIRRSAFLSNAVPFAAAVALALPAAINGTAVLADEGGNLFGHGPRRVCRVSLCGV